MRHPDVVSVTASANLPLVWEDKLPARRLENSEEEITEVGAYGIDYDLFETLSIEFVQGRAFSREHGDEDRFIINETAIEKLNLKDPIGQSLIVGERSGAVIGVTKDFLFDDIGFNITPGVLYLEPENLNYILIKYASADSYLDIREQLEKHWQALTPDLPFECHSMSYHFDQIFGFLFKIAGFFNIFGMVAVFFSCLGLLGLASYMIERRTKEIGIRKVLGAPRLRVIWNLIKEFIVLVAIANAIACPIIFILWRRVLQMGLLYMVNINPGTYIFAASVSLITALIAVSSQTWKIVQANPVESLRYE